MDAVPAVDEDRLTLGFDCVIYLLVDDSAPLSFPPFVSIVEAALLAMSYRRTTESGAI
jgi:hypothetical protein